MSCINTAPPHVFVGLLFVPCSIWCSFGLCDAEKSRNVLSVLKRPPTMPCRLAVSLRRADGSCSITGRTRRFLSFVHNRMCIDSCCCTWLWALSCVRVVGLVFTITTDGRSSASNGTFVRVQILASQQTPPPPNHGLRPTPAFALERVSYVSIVTRLHSGHSMGRGSIPARDKRFTSLKHPDITQYCAGDKI